MHRIIPIFITFLLISCAVEPVSNSQESLVNHFDQSSALRITLEHLLKNEEKGFVTKSKLSDLCFQFDYPIAVQYNTGDEVVISDFDELLQKVLSETLEIHITKMAFPFNVNIQSTGNTITIYDETEFMQLVTDCGYDSIEYVDVISESETCFTINYPIDFTINNNPVSFTSEEEAQNYFIENYGNLEMIALSYPLSITLNGEFEELKIYDDYELIHLITEICGFQ